MRCRCSFLVVFVVLQVGAYRVQGTDIPRQTGLTAEQLYALYQARDYFELEKHLGDLDPKDDRRVFFEGQINSAFLRDEQAEEELTRFLQLSGTQPEWRKEAWLTLGHGRLRRNIYGLAAQALGKALEEAGASFTATERRSAEQDFAESTALSSSPSQTRDAYAGPSTVNATRGKSGEDYGGFIYIDFRVNHYTEDAVFDTLANGNVVSESYARRHRLRLLPDHIKFWSSTGKESSSQLAMADEVQIGNMTFHHVVFNVVPDADFFRCRNHHPSDGGSAANHSARASQGRDRWQYDHRTSVSQSLFFIPPTKSGLRRTQSAGTVAIPRQLFAFCTGYRGGPNILIRKVQSAFSASIQRRD